MTEQSSAAAATVVAKPPSWSSVWLSVRTPSRGIAPKLGLKPTTPQKAAGRMIEPAVWVPVASGSIPAATAAADPIEEPPGVREGSHGLVVGPGVAEASSAVTVLPTTTPPAASILATAVAERPGTRPRKSAEPRSVGMPAVSITSLLPTPRPRSAPGGAAAEDRRARSRSSQAKARTAASRSRVVAAQTAGVWSFIAVLLLLLWHGQCAVTHRI